jgi:transposase-like protein
VEQERSKGLKIPLPVGDGVFFGVRGERGNQCVLTLVGVREDGRKELAGLTEGFAESADSWKDILKSPVPFA